MQPSTCYRHADRVTGVTCTRCGRAICVDCMVQASVGHHCPSCVAEAARAPGGERRVRWDRPGRTAPATVAVLGLIAVNVAVFLVDRSDPTIQLRFADNPLLVARGDVYRLLTAAFLHANLLHLGLNMFGLYLFGPPLESALGKVRFLALYLLSALGAGVCFYYFASLGTFSVGASGAVFGLFGAFFVMLRSRGGDTSQIVGLIVINLFIGASVPGIDNYAHIGGLLTGGAVAFLYDRAAAAAAGAAGPGATRRRDTGARAAVLQVVGVSVMIVVLAALAGSRGRQLRAREGVGYVVSGVVVGSQAGRPAS